MAVFVFGAPGGEPWIAAFFVRISLLLLALPVVAGLVSARVLTASGWNIALAISSIGLGLLLGPLVLARVGQLLFGL